MPRGIKLAHGETLVVSVRSREAAYFRGKAAVVSSVNEKGEFDILPRHAHFITLIRNGVTIIKPDGTNVPIKFARGILKVKDDVVDVYIGTGRR